MHTGTIRAPRRRLLNPLIAALAAAAACGAWADEPVPYYIGATASFTHDSNVYRVPDGPGDNFWSTGLLGGFDQSFNRQHVYAAANVQYNKYSDQTTLDNTSYGVNAGWDWATIEKLSGRFYGSANQSLASFTNNATVPTTTRNILKTDQLGTSVRWGGDGLLSLEGGYAYSRVRYSAPQYLFAESSANSGSAGVYYQAGPTLKLGAAVRLTRTYAPYGIQLVTPATGPGDYTSSTSDGRNIDLTAEWRPTEQSRMNARLSFTKQTHPGGSNSDFSGLTGAISGNWAVTGKTSLSASLSRDAGSNSQFFNVPGATTPSGGAVTQLNENSRTTDSVTLGAAYAATAKIQVNAGWQYGYSKLVNTFSSGNASASSDESDISRAASLSANYAIARGWLLACNISRQSRGVSGAGGFGYDANIASCSAQFTLR